ncbi:hypothetical protein Uis1B_1218 [Bifidobacterium margollesii]|uniref:Uncharacterized protein n=1 Tax=Bifidobacterium margollesii TaxID=2020964 RepID=A0A2N5J9Q2_9BIFI|nr:hypothetical protein [Bifidobacterium margollesii]PLS30928.1 hypothetical protein Uis1B_1218 [Bifidobacterium margollesii]
MLRNITSEWLDHRNTRLAVLMGASSRWPVEQRTECQRRWLGERRIATVFADKKQCDEYDTIRAMLPAIGPDNAFRFRLTGRHRATGVYNPVDRALAVDPRHPDSTFHEMTHDLTMLAFDPGRVSWMGALIR